MATNPMAFQREALRWEAVRERESQTGEARLNLIRLCALLVFYAYHLISFYWLEAGKTTFEFHVQVAALVLAWSSEVVALYYCAFRGWLRHPLVKYASLGWDVAMISCLLILCDRPSGAFVMLYLLVIASSVLRLSVALIYFATVASIAGYLFALGQYVFLDVGYQTYFATPALRLSRNEQILVVLALLTSGFVAGQILRLVKRAAYNFAVVEN